MDKSYLSFFPFLSFWWRGSIFTFIIFFRDIIPVCRENCSSTGLKTFHHCLSFFLISIFENLFEKCHTWILTILFSMLQNLSFDLSVNFIPISFDFGAWWINYFIFCLAFRNSKSISSKKGPILALWFFFHDHFDLIKSVYRFWSRGDYFFEKNQIKMIFSSSLYWKVNHHSILVKLHLQILLLFHYKRNFNADFGGSLVPRIGKFMSIS